MIWGMYVQNFTPNHSVVAVCSPHQCQWMLFIRNNSKTEIIPVFHLSSTPMWSLSILLSANCPEGSIAASLQRRVHLPDPAILPLQVRPMVMSDDGTYGPEYQLWIHVFVCVIQHGGELCLFCTVCCVSGWSHAFLVGTVYCVQWQHVRACLHGFVRTWLSCFN